jgi:hypothetical protein
MRFSVAAPPRRLFARCRDPLVGDQLRGQLWYRLRDQLRDQPASAWAVDSRCHCEGFCSSAFLTSLSRPYPGLRGVCSEFALCFALRFALRFVLCFALRFALRFVLCFTLRFAVTTCGVSRFADGCAGFRQSRDFEISISTEGDRAVALLAARTGRVVVARRRLSRISRRVVPVPASPAHRIANRLGQRWRQPTTTRQRAA